MLARKVTSLAGKVICLAKKFTFLRGKVIYLGKKVTSLTGKVILLAGKSVFPESHTVIRGIATDLPPGGSFLPETPVPHRRYEGTLSPPTDEAPPAWDTTVRTRDVYSSRV